MKNQDSTTDNCTYKVTATDFRNFVNLLPAKKDLPRVDFKQIFITANTTLCSSGISTTLRPGFKSIGLTYQGKPIFGMNQLIDSSDATLGSQKIRIASDLFNHLGAFRNSKEKRKFDEIGDYTNNQTLIKTLDSLSEKNLQIPFINELLRSLSQTPFKNLTWDTENQRALETAFSAYITFAVWDRFSVAQKGMCLSNFGINAYRFSNGDSFKTRQLIVPSKGNPGLRLEDAFNYLQKGINSFALVRHWSELNLIYQVGAGNGTSAGVSYFVKSLGMLGAGLRGDSVQDMTQGLIESTGYKPAPQFGMGAIYNTAKGANPPKGYVIVHADDRGTLAIPPANKLSAIGALVDAVFIGNSGGKSSVSASAFGIYDSWDNAYGPNQYNATLAGSQIAAGLDALINNNPFILGGIVTAFTCYNCEKNGQSTVEDQNASVKRIYRRIGLGGTDYTITLANGTSVKLIKESEEKSDDDTYGNEVGFLATLCGISLARILAGGKSPEIDACGEQIGDAAASNVRPGILDSDSLESLIVNFKSIFAQSGIKSKSDAFQLANQAFAELRLNDSDTTCLHIMLNIIYDDTNIDFVSSLLSGRQRGYDAIEATNEEINTIHVIGTDDSNFDSEFPSVDTTLKNPKPIKSKEEMQASNRRKGEQEQQVVQQQQSQEQEQPQEDIGEQQPEAPQEGAANG